MNQDGIWLSIIEYASIKKTSISTIRRSIKAGLLKHREENGKYLIWTKDIAPKNTITKNQLENHFELDLLKKKNRELQEEVDDLKMLLAVYENQNKTNAQLPPLPKFEQ